MNKEYTTEESADEAYKSVQREIVDDENRREEERQRDYED